MFCCSNKRVLRSLLQTAIRLSHMRTVFNAFCTGTGLDIASADNQNQNWLESIRQRNMQIS